MKLLKIYTALLTANLETAENWYTKLLGRGPDNRPMDSLVQWELFEHCGFAISTDKEIAGKGVMFIYVEDVDSERSRLRVLALNLGKILREITRLWLKLSTQTATYSH